MTEAEAIHDDMDESGITRMRSRNVRGLANLPVVAA
jgi:hypothetical protein